MTNKKFIESLEKTYKKCVDIVKVKNADYATTENPFRNFEFAKILDMSVEEAILLRTVDKIARIYNLLDKEPKVLGEKLTDTIEDCINYLAILKAYREQ